MNATVAALATPQGAGGVAIVRISGGSAREILSEAFKSKREIKPRYARYGFVTDADGEVIDEAIALFMPAPHSYTREDVAEIQCHGGRAAAAAVLDRVRELGAQPAEPGEFTKRAFLNGRLDMAQAEAVMSVVSAGNMAALRSGERQLRGGVSRRVADIAARITSILCDIEAHCDFPEEVDSDYSSAEVIKGIDEAISAIDAAVDPRSARMITRGVSVALIGRPNTGKSSLMNALTGFDRAIVSSVPGTTRDAVTSVVEVGGVLLNLTDTAGQRETSDEIESIGVGIARRTESEADVVVAVIDGSLPLESDDRAILARADDRFIIAVNKSDLNSRALISSDIAAVVKTSAVTPGGVKPLVQAILDKCSNADPDRDILTVERHISLAREARLRLIAAREGVEAGYPLDLCAVDVQSAAQSILSIRGLDASQEAITAIFSRFCVGK